MILITSQALNFIIQKTKEAAKKRRRIVFDFRLTVSGTAIMDIVSESPGGRVSEVFMSYSADSDNYSEAVKYLYSIYEALILEILNYPVRVAVRKSDRYKRMEKERVITTSV